MLKIYSFYKTERLNPPVMTLDVRAVNAEMTHIWRVQGLPDGGILVVNKKEKNCHAVRLDNKGAIKQTLLVSSGVMTGFILLSNAVLILQKDGTITKHNPSDGKTIQTYSIFVDYLWAGIASDNENLLLVDNTRGEIFSYHLSTKTKEVKVQGLNCPTAVMKVNGRHGEVYAVCEAAHQVHIYDLLWNRQTSIGGQGSGDGQLDGPYSVVSLPTGNILVADYSNRRISEFSTEGRFACHILREKDGIYKPWHLSYQHPNLWVVILHSDNTWHLKCYKLFMR